MPLVSGPQAVVWAERSASRRLDALAVAQLRPPLYSTHTSHFAAWASIVVQMRMATKPATSKRASIVFRLEDIGQVGCEVSAVGPVDEASQAR